MNDFKEKWTLGKEKKQRVNLSRTAYDTICQDIDFFGVKDSRSDFVCRIVMEYLEKDKSELPSCEKYPEKNTAFNITLKDDLVSILFEEEKEFFTEHYPGAGAFIKAVLEDYASMRNYDREKLYFGRLVSDIESCMESRTVMVIKKEGKMFDVRPVRLVVDPYTLYNYLIGFSRPHGEKKDKEKLASFRLSRINEDFRPYREFSGKITAEERAFIEKRLETVYPAYFLDDPEDIVVRLTEKGKKKYTQILHLRPVCLKITDNDYYHFRCSRYHAMDYFVRFYEDAVIVSPKPLADEMKKRITAAAEAYTK